MQHQRATPDPTQSQTRCKTRPDAKPQNQNPKTALFRGQVHPTARSKLPRHATINPTHPRIQHGRTLSSRIDSHPSFPYDPHIASPRLEPLYCSHSFPSFWLLASGFWLPAAGCRLQAAGSKQLAAGSWQQFHQLSITYSRHLQMCKTCQVFCPITEVHLADPKQLTSHGCWHCLGPDLVF